MFEQAKVALAGHENNVDMFFETHAYDDLNAEDLAKLRKRANNKDNYARKSEKSVKIAQQEEEKDLPNEDSASINAARQNHAINMFHQ